MNQESRAIFAAAGLDDLAAEGGKVIYLNPANGSDGNTGLSPDKAVATYERGYALLTANKNEILAYTGDSSGLTLTALAVWAKSFTHLVGLCAPTEIAQRARLFLASTVITSPMLTVSASGCKFKNLYLFHGIANAGALVCCNVTGGRNKFENIHFAGIGHATQGDTAGARSLLLTGAEENLFERCTIGVDTIARSTTNAEIEFATQATRNYFRDCKILAFADNAGHLFIKAAASSLDRFAIFENCIFSNPILSTATTMTEAIDGNAGAGGYILLKNCTLMGATDWEGTQTITYIDGAAPTGNTSGLAVVVA